MWRTRNLHQHHYRILNQRLECADQDRAERAVNGAIKLAAR
jgi:hypothetical protein